MRRSKPKSAAVYCNLLIEHYPTSPFANQARDLLAELGRDNTNHLWANYAVPGKKSAEKEPEPSRFSLPGIPGFGGDEPKAVPAPSKAPAEDTGLEPPARLRLDGLDEPIRRIPSDGEPEPARIQL
jgi:hypothetical protein